jgi:S1-C subfamily serine protease
MVAKTRELTMQRFSLGTAEPDIAVRAGPRLGVSPGALGVLLLAGVAAAEQGDRAELYEKARQASLEILVDDHQSGSGVMVEQTGTALTAAHVLGRPGSRVEILSPVAGRRKAKVVAVDLGHDLAVLRIEPRPDGYPAMPLAEAAPQAGEDVFLLGTPIFRHGVMIRGMIARGDATFEFYGDRYVGIVHVNATVQFGMSGGPWFNAAGEVVGIQSGVMKIKDVPAGIAFMVPFEALRGLTRSQKTAATASPGLAVEETWQQQRDFLRRIPPRTEGLVVKVLKNDGPAARAGVKQWDVITEADGQTIRMPDELLRLIRSKTPGDTLKLTLLSPDGAGTRQVDVRLGKLEVAWPASPE